MTSPWHVVGHEELSRSRSEAVSRERADEGAGFFLGVAAFCIQELPDSRRGDLRLMELDESLSSSSEESEGEGSDHEGHESGEVTVQGSADDLVATLRFRPRGDADVRVTLAPCSDPPSDEDVRLRLEFYLPAELAGLRVEAGEDPLPAPPEHRCLEVRVPYEAASDEHVLHFAILSRREEYSNQTPVRFDATRWFEPEAGDEWSWRRPPRASQTAGGFPIEQDRYQDRAGRVRTKRAVRIASNVRLELTQGGPEGERHHGIYYRGHNAHGALARAQAALDAEYGPEGQDDPYLRLLTYAYDVLGEGATSAINTYDNCIITLGAGWSGMSKGLNMLLRYVCESPAGDRMRAAFSDVLATDERDSPLHLSEENALRFDTRWTRDRCWDPAAWELRTAVSAWAAYVRLAESQAHGVHLTQADVKTLVEYDNGYHCKQHESRQSGEDCCEHVASDAEIGRVQELAQRYFAAKDEPRRRGNAEQDKALALRALAGIAAYLHHGRPGIAKPVKDLLFAWSRGSTPTQMIAYLLKKHVQDCGSSVDGRKLLDRAMNHKLPHFRHAYRIDSGERGWGLDTDAIQRVIPCYRGPAGDSFGGYRLWTAGGSPSQSRPSGVSVHITNAESASDNGYYHFGPRLS